MILKQTWIATSLKPDWKNDDLSKLVGKWSVNIHVEISNPVTVQHGPIEHHRRLEAPRLRPEAALARHHTGRARHDAF